MPKTNNMPYGSSLADHNSYMKLYSKQEKICECGKKMRMSSYCRHRKSKQHLKTIALKIEELTNNISESTKELKNLKIISY
jgi:hypothetical protein